MLGVPVNELLWLALLIVAGGVVTGLLAGLFGIGGGGIIVPVLYEVFRRAWRAGRRAHAALHRHVARDHRADHDPLLSRAHEEGRGGRRDRAAMDGAGDCRRRASARRSPAFAPSSVFKIAFIFFCLVIGGKMLFGKESWRLGDDLPGNPLMCDLRLHHRACCRR